MYIIVRASDNVIVGTSDNPINIADCSRNNRLVYEIDEKDFDKSMLGQKLENFEET